ncbi:MAG: amidase [Psychrobacillus sp.]
MNLHEYANYDGLGLAELVKTGQVTPKELVDLALEGIDKVNPQLNGVWQILKEQAYKEIEAGLPEGDFQGVPFLIKEILLHAKDVTTNFGSRFAEGVSFPVDSFLMESFRKAGFVTIGTTSTPEWGYNATTEGVLYGPTHNPWGLGHSSGGSSGGAAASVASGIVPIAHGNDGGGSIRIPAANSGVIGLKPTRGRVSAGPFNSEPLAGNGIEFALTKSIRDTAALLDAVSVERPGEYCYAPRPKVPYKEGIKKPVGKLRISYSTKTALNHEPTDEVVAALNKTVELLRSLGHEVVEDYPEYDGEEFLAAVNDIWSASVAGMIEAVAAMKGEEPTEDVIEAAIWDCYQEGKNMSALRYKAAIEIQAKVSRQVGEFFTKYDVALSPTMGSEPVKHDVLNANNPNISALQLTHQMLGQVATYTALYNATGQPALSLPLHLSNNNLPIGMQFAGRYGDETTLLQLGKQLEEAVPWIDRKPAIHVSPSNVTV